jgi:hypothetical protein
MSKFKFKVGDKVKTSSFEDIKTNTADRWMRMNDRMEKLVGEEGTIIDTENYHGILRYHVDAGGGWMWPESSLTLVEAKGTCQIKPGDKVNVSFDNNEWTDSDEIYYIGMDRRGDYVVETKSGDLTSWEYCRPFKKKTTYNVWKFRDTETLLAVKENAPSPSGEWTMVHTFTI